MQEHLILRHKVSMAIRKCFDEEGFIEVETPILTKSTPEGARDYLVPSRVHDGQFFALPQSPQLFKQLLMIAGMDRYFQIARCFRDEDLRADRQPEFTQVDVEISFATPDIVFGLIEPVIKAAFAEIGVDVPLPLPRMPLQRGDGQVRLRQAGPALRDGDRQELTPAFAATTFAPFREALDAKGVVRGLVVPGAASSFAQGSRDPVRRGGAVRRPRHLRAAAAGRQHPEPAEEPGRRGGRRRGAEAVGRDGRRTRCCSRRVRRTRSPSCSASCGCTSARS